MSNVKAGKYACYEFERKFLLNELPAQLEGSQDYSLIEDKYFSGTNLRLRIVRSFDGKKAERKLTQKYVDKDSNPAKTTITNIYIGESEFDLLL